MVAKAQDGAIHTCTLSTVSDPAQLQVKVDTAELHADGQDIAHIEIQITDENGRPVYTADHPIALTIEGPGEIIGMENGNIQDLEPYSSRTRKAHHGKLLVYVRTTTQVGEIVVTAEAEGLGTSKVTIKSVDIVETVQA